MSEEGKKDIEREAAREKEELFKYVICLLSKSKTVSGERKDGEQK